MPKQCTGMQLLERRIHSLPFLSFFFPPHRNKQTLGVKKSSCSFTLHQWATKRNITQDNLCNTYMTHTHLFLFFYLFLSLPLAAMHFGPTDIHDILETIFLIQHTFSESFISYLRLTHLTHTSIHQEPHLSFIAMRSNHACIFLWQCASSSFWTALI